MEAGGIYRLRTHSWHSVSGILAALKYISDNTNGILQGLPLKLKFLKKSTQDHGNVNVVTVVLDGLEMMKMREIALTEYSNRMKLGIDMKMIENQARDSGFVDDKDDPEDIQAEFYPVVSEPEAMPGVSSDEATDKLKSVNKPVTPVTDSLL
jgi:hypothetical protein